MQHRILFATTVGVSARAFTADHIDLMDRSQWDITVTCADDGQMDAWADGLGEVRFRGVSMVRDPSPLRDLRALIQLIRVIGQQKPDVAVYGTPKASLLTSLAAVICRVPSRVYVVHGLRYETATGLRRTVLKSFERVTHAASTKSVAVSRSVAAKVEADLSCVATVLGEGSIAGVDTDYFNLSSGDNDTNGRLRLVFLGRVSLDKGIARILDICAELEKRAIPYSFDLVGPDELGRDELKLRDRLNERRNIRMHGRQEDVRPFLGKADVLVLPSAREGLGLVLLEAAACGVPSVATEVTGCVDVLRGSKMGRLVPPDAGPEKWVNEIERVVAEAGSRKCRVAIREEVIARFNRKLVCSRWVEFYRGEAYKSASK